MNIQDGYVNLKDGKIWYQIHSTPATQHEVPLVILHGGPGIPHDYLLSLAPLDQDRPVIYYDQLGCGNSSLNHSAKNLWTLARFVQELETLATALNLSQFNLLGHSWGGLLAAEYAIAHPERLQSLILASPLLDTALWIQDAKVLVEQLPKETQDNIFKHEGAGTTDSAEYQEAVGQYYKLMCRVPKPQNLLESLSRLNPEVYQTMWGPSEFTVTGNLKTASCLNQLSKITVPVLITCGRFDSAAPRTMEKALEKLTYAEHKKLVVFEHSAHMPHLEEPERYLKEIEDFLGSLQKTEKSYANKKL